MNKIVYRGNSYQKGTLREVDGFIGDALASEKLAVDTLDAVVVDRSTETMLLIADGLPAVADGLPAVASQESVGLDLRSRYGDVVEYYRGDTKFGKFYLAEKIKRTGKAEYSMSCVSAIGLLLTENHYGGLYNGETASEVIADVIGGIVEYTLDASLASVPLYGWLKKATRRDNLRDILFAIGGQIRKTVAGEVNIVPMESKAPYEITADEFYMGGSVTGGNPATGIKVTEHSFVKLPSDELVSLYDGESAAEELVTPKGERVSGVLVDFSEPVYDLTIENATILERGANYAVISGSPAAILKGKKYTHTQRIISREQDTGGSPNVLTSSECTLVNLMNSELVADRLMAYYGKGKRIEADIVVTNQRPGDSVSFTDPFGDPDTGFISDMELTMSAILKAKTTIVTGFIPTASGNYYSNVAVLRESGTFTVPASCKGKIRVVLIGGGDGGEAGQDGGTATSGSSNSAGTPGVGGEPGKAGQQGKVFVATIATKPGDTFAVNIGAKGIGAEYGGTPTKGGETTFGKYSTADGFRPDSGYPALLTNGVYATPGSDGVRGGDGQQTDGTATFVSFGGETWYSGKQGATITDSGAVGQGGFGGGPAVGANGSDGTDGWAGLLSGGQVHSEGGDGGDGATPIDAPDTDIPGQGGHGGHGGGGAGVGGGATSIWHGDLGAPGRGGHAGNGGSGLALVYY